MSADYDFQTQAQGAVDHAVDSAAKQVKRVGLWLVLGICVALPAAVWVAFKL
jgi:hypothetical protein